MLPLNVTPFQLPDRYCQVDEKLAVPAMAVGSRAGAVVPSILFIRAPRT